MVGLRMVSVVVGLVALLGVHAPSVIRAQAESVLFEDEFSSFSGYQIWDFDVVSYCCHGEVVRMVEADAGAVDGWALHSHIDYGVDRMGYAFRSIEVPPGTRTVQVDYRMRLPPATSSCSWQTGMVYLYSRPIDPESDLGTDYTTSPQGYDALVSGPLNPDPVYVEVNQAVSLANATNIIGLAIRDADTSNICTLDAYWDHLRITAIADETPSPSTAPPSPSGTPIPSTSSHPAPTSVPAPAESIPNAPPVLARRTPMQDEIPKQVGSAQTVTVWCEDADGGDLLIRWLVVIGGNVTRSFTARPSGDPASLPLELLAAGPHRVTAWCEDPDGAASQTVQWTVQAQTLATGIPTDSFHDATAQPSAPNSGSGDEKTPGFPFDLPGYTAEVAAALTIIVLGVAWGRWRSRTSKKKSTDIEAMEQGESTDPP